MTGFPGVHNGSVAVVTGGARGLGRAYAERLARDGAKLVVADVEDADETVANIIKDGGEAIAVRGDISVESDVAALRDATVERFGRCDILVNNAGIAPNIAWDDLDFATWRRVFEVNLDAMFLTCKAYVPLMREQGFGRIINISSNTFDLAISGFAHYVASKGGVIGLTRALASDLGEAGITVNAVLPGLTRTAYTERQWEGSSLFDEMAATQAIKRHGLPHDLEAAVSFLATEDARWITGQALVVDGGLVRH